MSNESDFLFGNPDQFEHLRKMLKANQYKELGDVEFYGDALPNLRSTDETYKKRMQLNNELAEVAEQFRNPIIWDVGAGGADATCDLQEEFRDRGFRFLAVNPHYIPRLFQTPYTVPYIISATEQLATAARTQTSGLEMYPPVLIILSNVLQYSYFADTLDIALLNVDAVVSENGRVLIYEDPGEIVYDPYIEKVKSLGLRFDVQRKPGQGFCRAYLRLDRVK
jgi:hypothetical protein